MTKLKLGLIGAWNRGCLANIVHEKPELAASLVAGADVSAVNLGRFVNDQKEKYHNIVNGYSDYREMIEKEHLDGVIITSPDFCHCDHACFCLNHNVPVYLEKPLSTTIAGSQKILEAAQLNRTQLMLGHNMRYMKFVLKMREIIQSGEIGEVKAIWVRHFISYGGDAYFRDWHADRSLSTSLLLQKGAHDIDVIHWLAGSYAQQVSGMGGLSLYGDLPRRKQELPKDQVDVSFNKNHWPPMEQKDFNPIVDVEDINMINMRLANGVFASYMQCMYTPDSCRNYTVIGTKGRIENYGDYSQKATIELWNKRNDSFLLDGNESFDVSPEAGAHGGADERIVSGFVEMLRGKHTPNSTPQAAFYSIATGCCGAESIRDGGMTVAIPRLPEGLEKYDFARLNK